MRCKQVAPVLLASSAAPVSRGKTVVDSNIQQLNLQEEPTFCLDNFTLAKIFTSVYLVLLEAITARGVCNLESKPMVSVRPALHCLLDPR